MRTRAKLLFVMIAASITLAATASSAAAAPGDATVNVSANGGTPCILEFDHASPPAMSNLVHPFTCPGGLDMSTATLSVAFSGGVATMSGSFSVDLPGGLGTCTYSAAVTGTYADSTRFRYFNLGPQAVPRISGSFLCPSPLPDLEFSNGVIEL